MYALRGRAQRAKPGGTAGDFILSQQKPIAETGFFVPVCMLQEARERICRKIPVLGKIQ